MKKQIQVLILYLVLCGCETTIQSKVVDQETDRASLLKTIDHWTQGWENKDVNLAIQDYANDIDWTNAFGDRVTNKEELKQLLEVIFGFDFVMLGQTEYVENDIEFLDQNYVTVRSKSIRKGQKNGDGSLMADRIVNHLRVYRRDKETWKIVNHMISQVHEKR
ncbi:hypothetical protein [Portibacter lacus]|uniref:DUF4440 domain-containing protein n=1 Tax=Portibacter lacus TaxID=1099794 RepID=A0AA37SUC0_9BACT|nr:hypothetical protein [Portibacter lacus]GLR19879.1 hypothetical protein GCM10007940_44950 [Portibacter lacus]